MSTHNSSKQCHQSKKNASEEIGEMPRDENSAQRPGPGPGPPAFAASKRATQADLNTAVDFNPRNQNRNSLSKIGRVLKQRSNSKGKTPLLGRGTQNRGRFLSLDSSDIFRSRSGNSNRRSSWYGGNIRNFSLTIRKHSKTSQSTNPTRKCSKASVQTLDSDGLPVHCGINFDVRVDVHRTASGTPVDTGVGKVQPTEARFARLDGRKPNTIVSVERSSHTLKSHQNVPEIVVDKTELYEFNGSFCRWWLLSIDKITRRCPCPGCSPYLGPVLITISLCAGFVIVLSVIVLFSWILVKVGSWWA